MKASEKSGKGGARGTTPKGARGERARSASADGGARIVPVDFSRPTRFAPELRHRVAAALTPFTEALALRLEGELKCEVSVGLGELAEHTWASARAQLPADALAVALAQQEAPPLLLSVEHGLLLCALDCLLGGRAADAQLERALTEIDWALARELLEGFVGELCQAWSDLGAGELSLGALDLEGDAGIEVAASEPTLLVRVGATLDGRAGELALLIPWPAAHALAASAGGAPSPSAPERDAEHLQRRLAGAAVLLRVEVGSVQMPAQRMVELAPGSLLALEQHAEDGVLLFAEGVSIGRGRPGRSGERRAVKIEASVDPPVRAARYATLGRAVLARARVEQDAGGAGILHNIFLRVWAELGRTHMPLGHALELRPGSLVELDQDAEAPVELFANGLCFAAGKLVVTAEGRWGIELQDLR